jgi:hypothetical protein
LLYELSDELGEENNVCATVTVSAIPNP